MGKKKSRRVKRAGRRTKEILKKYRRLVWYLTVVAPLINGAYWTLVWLWKGDYFWAALGVGGVTLGICIECLKNWLRRFPF